jgi:hypothetical protein
MMCVGKEKDGWELRWVGIIISYRASEGDVDSKDTFFFFF